MLPFGIAVAIVNNTINEAITKGRICMYVDL